MSGRSFRGQATIEYLVLLAVALIIALVVFGLIGFVPGLAGSLQERQSRLFWSSQFPVAIKDYKFTPTGSEFFLQNVADFTLTIISIEMGGQGPASPSPSPAKLLPGESKKFTFSGITCTTSGTNVQFDNITISYDVTGGISGQKERGDLSLIGRCV